MPEFYLNKEYRAKLETLAQLTGKSKTQLIKEAIDLLWEKYMKEFKEKLGKQ